MAAVESSAASAPPLPPPSEPPPAESSSLPESSAAPECSGYEQAAQALAPSAPLATAPEFDTKMLARCARLTVEALRIEGRAAELDSAGSVAEAIFHHRRANLKLIEAASTCPNEHPDKVKIEEYAQDIQLRMVYLEGLGGAPPTLPLDEHVVGIELTMDLSSAEAPEEGAQQVADLVAKTGASGSNSALTEDGYKLVAALKSREQMKVFIERVLAAAGRQIQAGADSEMEGLVFDFSGERQTQTLAALQDSLLRAPWVELILDPKKDKLELAMDLEKEGRRFEEIGLKDRAVDMFNRSCTILQFVINRDDRMKNAKVKEMVTKRLQDLQAKSASLKLQI